MHSCELGVCMLMPTWCLLAIFYDALRMSATACLGCIGWGVGGLG